MFKRLKKNIAELVYNISSKMKGFQLILIDYPMKSFPRYGYGKPPHQKLQKIISNDRIEYKKILEKFLNFKEKLLKIPRKAPEKSIDPCWINNYLPGLDAIALYSLIVMYNPKRYFEIGAGYSTKFVRRAIRDHGLRTKIISIDPHPRLEISSISDKIVRKPLEDVDLRIFGKLKADDFLFIDGSHRCFMNSDVAVVFLDILPYLTDNVLIHFHDISLPIDYSSKQASLYYSEQYLLAVYLLAKENRVKIILPNSFVSRDMELNSVLDPLWNNPKMKGTHTSGNSFWIKKIN